MIFKFRTFILILVLALSSLKVKAQICENVFRLPKESSLALQDHLIFLRETVTEITNKKPISQETWTCSNGMCYPLSQQLFNALIRVRASDKKLNLQRIVYTGPAGYAPGAAVHAYIVDFTQETPIIIDPTYLQFLGGKYGLNLPEVFIGTREELGALFRTYRNRLSPQTGRDVFAQIDPILFVEGTWPLQDSGHGRFDIQTHPYDSQTENPKSSLNNYYYPHISN